jgi:2-polyprenyl-6-hydroxyphenyl methylase/3-demethylubiquinone-9 3-methyltransferase
MSEQDVSVDHEREIAQGNRFEFGRNWERFLNTLNEEKIEAAKESLRAMLQPRELKGGTFLDAGSGSGLFSLAARLLGATVFSFDYDSQSVACTSTLRRKFSGNDESWRIEQGSVLDKTYMSGLGQFDIVYSWGVLHHTGNMWSALDNVASCVARRGSLFIAIYNDQGWTSKYWAMVKRAYNKIPVLKPVLVFIHFPYLFGARFLARFMTGRLKLGRGMNLWHDMLDWIGGFPFEVARPEEILDFCRQRGFVLTRLRTCGGKFGCNEFVFTRE